LVIGRVDGFSDEECFFLLEAGSRAGADIKFRNGSKLEGGCYGYAPGMSTADLFRIYILSAYVFRSFPKHIRRLSLFSASSFFLIMVSVPCRLYCLIVLLGFTINLQFTSYSS